MKVSKKGFRELGTKGLHYSIFLQYFNSRHQYEKQGILKLLKNNVFYKFYLIFSL